MTLWKLTKFLKLPSDFRCLILSFEVAAMNISNGKKISDACDCTKPFIYKCRTFERKETIHLEMLLTLVHLKLNISVSRK